MVLGDGTEVQSTNGRSCFGGMALLEDGGLGNNNHGQLGDGNTTSRPLPGKVVGLEGVRKLEVELLML